MSGPIDFDTCIMHIILVSCEGSDNLHKVAVLSVPSLLAAMHMQVYRLTLIDLGIKKINIPYGVWAFWFGFTSQLTTTVKSNQSINLDF